MRNNEKRQVTQNWALMANFTLMKFVNQRVGVIYNYPYPRKGRGWGEVEAP